MKKYLFGLCVLIGLFAIAQESDSTELKDQTEEREKLLQRIAALESAELVESMSQRSLLIPFYQPELKALIARQAFDFYKVSSSEKYVSHLQVYSALYHANKHLDYDSFNQKSFNQVIGHDEAVVSIKFSSKPNIFYSAGSDGRVFKWDLDDLNTIPTLIYSGNHLIKSIDVSDDDQLLLIVAKDVGIVLVNLTQFPKERPPTILDREYSQSAVFLPNQRNYLTINEKGELKVKGIRVQDDEIGVSDQKVLSLVVNPESMAIFAGTDKGNLKIWDRINQTNTYLENESFAINALAISSDNKMLAIGREKGDAILWDIEKRDVARVISGHQSAITDVDFSPDNLLLLTASRDRTARIWDLNNTRKLPTILDDHNDWVLTAKFDTDGKRIVTGSMDNSLRVWPVDPEVLATRICNLVSRNLTKKEWNEYVGEKFPYMETCPGQEN